MKRLLILMFLCISSFANAAITTSVVPTKININETFQLTLTLDNMRNNSSPELLPLIKDFEILGTERMVSYTSVNGKASSISQWIIRLKPKRAGNILIPAIKIGGEQSSVQSISVAVDNNVSTAPSSNRSVKDRASYTTLSAAADEARPYINQQVIYSVKLFNRQQLFGAQYIPPRVKNALLIPISEGKNYTTSINGNNYEVEELTYAIFPQKSGKLTIYPPKFSANIYSGFQPTQLNIQAKPVILDVLPLPNNIKQNKWLAAKSVVLDESFDRLDDNIVEGETITRTIKLIAYGTVAELLPTLEFLNDDNYNVYIDNKSLNNELANNEIKAVATYKVTYLFKKPGNVKIAPIKINWYDIVNKKMTSSATPVHDIVINKGKPSLVKQKQLSKHHYKIKLKSENKTLIYYILIILSVVLVFGFIVKQLLVKYKPKDYAFNNVIKTACKKNDPVLLKSSLITWAKYTWPNLNILNLHDIPITNIDFQEQIKLLSEVIYSKGKKSLWDGNRFWRVFASLNLKSRSFKTKTKDKDLPSMYLN